ncbi:ribonuclease H-like domain-containing protein [Mycolicibacterium sp. S2-37]|uniref:ribonuclease H-like domain-containing protein n=1 Tax=Mycolicibacterium sp. S2-37 TaxID=2810297 RepID=UPI0027DA162F|nr:ribonuclease H-like domain-containing protein [Mycolicibacterium sp. S2-37]
MSAKILTLDLETQRAVVETFDLWPKFIGIDRVVVDKRILCFAAKWDDDEDVMFHAAWDDDDTAAYDTMIREAWTLYDQADIVVGWNSTRFDNQHFQAAFGRLGLGPPSPYKSLDLMQVAKKNFKAGEMSLKLDWFSRMWLGDRKTSHGGADLWHDIRYGTRAEKRAAQKVMQEYNIHDVELTEQLFEKFKPWTGINYAIYDSDADDGEMRCTKCASTNLQKRGMFFTTAFAYQRYRCNDCGSWSRGKRMVYSTELRPA